MPKQKPISSRTRSKLMTSPQNSDKMVSPKRYKKEKNCTDKNPPLLYRKGTGCVTPNKKRRANAGYTRAQWRAKKAGEIKGVTKGGESIY